MPLLSNTQFTLARMAQCDSTASAVSSKFTASFTPILVAMVADVVHVKTTVVDHLAPPTETKSTLHATVDLLVQ
jgi:predicted RNA binding protein with dsRBD fold (UPF0201 family)